MRLVVYALQFQGWSTVGGVDGKVLRATSRASDEMCSPPPQTDNLGALEAPGWSADAWQESELTFTGATTFQVVSAINFVSRAGEMHMSTAGSGYFNPEANNGGTYGAAISWIEQGDGQFAGASGLITSNLIVTGTGEVIEYHQAVLQLP